MKHGNARSTSATRSIAMATFGAGAALDHWVSVEVPLVAGNINPANSGHAGFEWALAHLTRRVNERVSALPVPDTPPPLVATAAAWFGLRVRGHPGGALSRDSRRAARISPAVPRIQRFRLHG
jgi:hypothetical protein